VRAAASAFRRFTVSGGTVARYARSSKAQVLQSLYVRRYAYGSVCGESCAKQTPPQPGSTGEVFGGVFMNAMSPL